MERGSCAPRTQPRRKRHRHVRAAPPRPPSCQWSTSARRGSGDKGPAGFGRRSGPTPSHGNASTGAGGVAVALVPGSEGIARPAPSDDTAPCLMYVLRPCWRHGLARYFVGCLVVRVLCCQPHGDGAFRPCQGFFFFEINRSYIKQASRLIKNLPVPLGTLVKKRVRQKLAACITVRLHHLRNS
jgi:hypothetical protein